MQTCSTALLNFPSAKMGLHTDGQLRARLPNHKKKTWKEGFRSREREGSDARPLEPAGPDLTVMRAGTHQALNPEPKPQGARPGEAPVCQHAVRSWRR